MELINKYMDETTLIADFWIADSSNEIQSFKNEGIMIEKSKIYLDKYMINIMIKKEYQPSLDEYAEGWHERFPKAVITKANKRVEAYELRYKKAVDKGEFVILEFVGELIT